MEMTRERISFTFEERDMLLSLEMRLFVRAAVACAILEKITVWGHHPKQLLQGTLNSTQLLSFYFYLSLDVIGAVCHQFGLLCTDLHLIPCAGFVETFD